MCAVCVLSHSHDINVVPLPVAAPAESFRHRLAERSSILGKRPAPEDVGQLIRTSHDKFGQRQNLLLPVKVCGNVVYSFLSSGHPCVF